MHIHIGKIRNFQGLGAEKLTPRNR